MSKSAEAVDTASLAGTGEAIVQLVGRFMDAIYQAFIPFMTLDNAKDRQAARSNYFEALDRSVKPVWMGIEEHEILGDYASMVELASSKSKAPDAVQFQLATRAGRTTEPTEENPDGYTTVGSDCVVITVISKGGSDELLEDPFTGETIKISDPSAEVSIKFEAVGIADIPANFTDGADFLAKLQHAVTKNRVHNPLDREFARNIEEEQEKRLADAGF